MTEERRDAVIVGGGAAGLLAAIAAGEAGEAGCAALVLDAAKEPGRKILVSGGGRCNVLPLAEAPGRFVSSSSPRLVKRFLDRFPLAEQRAFFEALLGGVLREEAESGKLFPPTNRARDVRDALVARARAVGAEIRSAAAVRDVTRRDDGFLVALDGASIAARRVLLASGGRSVLAPGADAAGLALAARLGHTVRPTLPALAPLVAEAEGGGARHADLSGVSLSARVTASWRDVRAEATGGFLFTHRGYSGPAVLDVSHVVERAALAGETADVRVAFGVSRGGPAVDWDGELRAGRGELAAFLKKRLPDRLVDVLLAEAGVAEVPLHRLTREGRRSVVEVLTAWRLPVVGTEGYRTAEVTGGGVALEEVDPGSGESRLVPGLHFAGEILDAFGPIGGFNFQWAWATGRTAGRALAAAGALRPPAR